MIDYVKILIKNPDIDFLLKNVELTFFREFSEETSECKIKKVATHHSCKITIYDSGTVLFTGSIHKFWNSINGVLAPNHTETKQKYKGYNGNDFALKDIFKIREYLQGLFNCKSDEMIFRNVEIGVNLNTLFDPKIFLKGLLYHKGKVFDSYYNRNFYQVKHQQYIVKVYNKGRQFDMPYHVLRFELKFLKMKELNNVGISTFADISQITLKKAEKVLLKRFDEVVYFDTTMNTTKMTAREKNAIKNYRNSNYWIDDLQPQHRDRHKKNLIKLIVKYSKKLQEQIKDLIIEKCVIINR